MGPSVCGNRSTYYAGLKVQYCADLNVFDAATGTDTAPPTNSQSDTTWDASIGGPLPQAGRFEIAQSIGGQTVIIRGAVVDGIPRIGTAFTP